MDREAANLANCGLEDLNPKPDHLLLCFDCENRLVLDESGLPDVRLCNLELVRRIRPERVPEAGNPAVPSLSSHCPGTSELPEGVRRV